MQVKWLKREIIPLPLYYTICTSRIILDKECKRLKVSPSLFKDPSTSGASTYFAENESKHTVAIVALFNHTYERNQIASLIAHEAVHIWQVAREEIGEKEPSKEFEAYAVQAIFQELLYEYDRQRKKRK